MKGAVPEPLETVQAETDGWGWDPRRLIEMPTAATRTTAAAAAAAIRLLRGLVLLPWLIGSAACIVSSM
jgi:hypothetical protein